MNLLLAVGPLTSKLRGAAMYFTTCMKISQIWG
jgi:hypothetical protein